jgi:hypothetical protein
MPNNGVISKYANIPSSFIVESAESTDLVIINTPLTGSKVEQKAVPVSALGGGGPATLPFNSFVYCLELSGTSNDSFVVYDDFPSSLGEFSVNVNMGGTSLDPVQVQINWNNVGIDLRNSFFSFDSYLTSVASNPQITKSPSQISFIVYDGLALQGTKCLFELRVYNLNP